MAKSLQFRWVMENQRCLSRPSLHHSCSDDDDEGLSGASRGAFMASIRTTRTLQVRVGTSDMFQNCDRTKVRILTEGAVISLRGEVGAPEEVDPSD